MNLKRKIELMVRSFRIHIQLLGILPTIKFFFNKHIQKKSELKILVKGKNVPIYLRNFTSDLRVFGQLMVNEEYKAGIELVSPKIILDCGANIGLASLYFCYHFPKAVIHAFEPEVSNYNMLTKNVSAYENIHTYENAVWNETTSLEIISNFSNDSFAVKSEGNDERGNKVEAVSINDFMYQKQINEIDLLKIDIEGAELQLFNNNLEWLNKTKVIIVEIHERFNPGSTDFITNLLKEDFNISYSGEYINYSRKHQ